MANNDTFIPTYETCTELSDRCPVEFTAYGTNLSKPAAAFFGIAFVVCFILQLYFGLRARTWSFMIWLGLGTIFEILGYWSRTKLADNPWDKDAFAQQYLTLLLAPTLVAAAISVTFKHIVLWYGTEWSVIRPSLYPWVFVGTDFISIFIQVVGGGLTAASTAGSTNKTLAQIGEKLVIGGVAFQVANMVCCGALMLVYVMRRKSSLKKGTPLSRNRHNEPMCQDADDQEISRVRTFVFALAVAYTTVLIRCSYRIAENIPAISVKVLRNEPLFLVLDGAMILIAIGTVSIFHPWIFFPFLKESKYLKDRRKSQQDYRMRYIT
ncbi:RTA1 like protein [Colletotrichum truncatum]|uniref:RTA1 like protein n=1 Tax=Colletotrichum truncatum TaxID=5467 RepID=A0ACC3Z2B2_COLTU|nr:RTA1 like protein [Colletotrichum truncatum]KAF6786521.1 RTA1 like protein [Colletotrichum truncatum]